MVTLKKSFRNVAARRVSTTSLLLGHTLVSAALLAGALTISLVVVGCTNQTRQVAPPPPPPPPPESTDVTHQVSYSGETLAAIADWYTGKAANWRAIRDANPGLKPERMRIGQSVLIPGDLVVRREPMPRRAVDSSRPKAKAAAQPMKTDDLGLDVPVGTATGLATADQPSSVPSQPSPGELNDSPAAPTVGGSTGDASAVVPPVSGDSAAPSTEPVVDVGKSVGSAAPAQPAAEGSPAGPSDAERERLLDELLAR